MRRAVHLRVHGAADQPRDALQHRWSAMVAARDWRGDPPWLADSGSKDLFSMEYFRHAAGASAAEQPELGPLTAAGFARLGGDECDALALLFMMRDLSEQLDVITLLRDPENPIAKLRMVVLRSGRLGGGAPLEAVLVARPIFKRLPGAVIEMYPPRALGSAFGIPDRHDGERRNWSFLVHGMRGEAAGFFEAEAEAMRIYRGLRGLG